MHWRAVMQREIATTGKPAYAYATIKPKYAVEPCCFEEHAWWITAGPMFLSTWKDLQEAVAECARLNEENASLSAATK